MDLSPRVWDEGFYASLVRVLLRRGWNMRLEYATGKNCILESMIGSSEA
jgi:hypothetical protein